MFFHIMTFSVFKHKSFFKAFSIIYNQSTKIDLVIDSSEKNSV